MDNGLDDGTGGYCGVGVSINGAGELARQLHNTCATCEMMATLAGKGSVSNAIHRTRDGISDDNILGAWLLELMMKYRAEVGDFRR